MSTTAMPTNAEADYKRHEDNHDLAHIPGDFGLPIVGQTFSLVKDFDGTIEKQLAKYGDVCKFQLSGFKGVLVMGHEAYQHILLDKDKNFSAEMGYAQSLGRFYKGALLLRDFEEHRFQRRMMQTAFKNDAMRGYMSDMAPLFDEAIGRWGSDPDFYFTPNIKQNLLDVAAKIFVGMGELNEDAQKLNTAFLHIAEGMMGIITKEWPFTRHRKGKRAERYLNEFFGSLIEERRAGDGQDTFSHFARELNENGEYFSDEDIIRHMTFLLFAAHDTTTSTLNHLILHLAEHPEWQDKLRAEARALGRDQLTYEDLDNMELYELVFKETLRMNPSVSMMQRRTMKEVEIDGHKVPADTIIYLPPVYNHFMPDYWSEPEKFDPYRFAEGREEHKSHSFAYMPFGGGAHKCIGMHFANMIVKCFLHQFLLNYEWSVKPGYKPKLEAFPLPKTADGLPLILKKIS